MTPSVKSSTKDLWKNTFIRHNQEQVKFVVREISRPGHDFIATWIIFSSLRGVEWSVVYTCVNIKFPFKAILYLRIHKEAEISLEYVSVDLVQHSI